MCAEYQLVTTKKKIDESIEFTIKFPGDLGDSFHVKIYAYAPVILLSEGKPEARMAQFSLKPPGTPFSSFNARLADWDDRKNKLIPIYDKPTWRKPFAQSRCLIPMSSFLEPVYSGLNAGKVMLFEPKDEELLLAAGLYQESPHPKVPGEIYCGFSLVVHTPLPYVLETGHHRSPVFLRPKAALAYLNDDSMSDQSRYEFLINERYIPNLTASPFRILAKGWERRIAENLKAHAEEMDFLNKIKSS